MRRTPYPGGWYADASPAGYVCVALRGQQRVITHEGVVETWPRDLLFVRCPPVGPFRCAGQEGDRPGHQGDGNYEYPAGVRVGDSISVSPVIYDLAGVLLQAHGSHQGYRYMTAANAPVTGDESYGPFHGLFEYSEAGPDLWIGQAAYDGGGVQVWDGTALRQLELGDCRFIRVQWEGESVTIAFATPSAAVIWEATHDELRALPLVELPEPPPDPDPTPEPPDPPVPPEPPQPTPRPYRLHKESHMADTLGAVRGPGGKLGRPDEKNTGPWAGEQAGWRGIVFDGSDKADPRYHFTRRGTALISQQTGAVAGCDATLHSGALDRQFYLKPDGDTGQGWAEEWQFYEGNANGAIEAQVEYAPGRGGDDGAFFSYPLAFEVIG